MLGYLIIGLIVVVIFCGLVKYYIEHGYYLPLSRKYGIRRYVFPKGSDDIARLAVELKFICRETLNGDLLKYPFFEDVPDKEGFSNRVFCVFYERNDPKETPVAFHASFVVPWAGLQIFHCGLTMVVPQHQGQGIQSLAAWNVAFYGLFHKIHVLTEIAASSSYLSIQDTTQDDVYPVWQSSGVPPKRWHLDVAEFMLANHRRDFGCSKYAKLDRTTLVVHGSNAKNGDGAWQLITTVGSRNSSNSRKKKFIEERLNNNEGDEQFYVGKPYYTKMLMKSIMKFLTSEKRNGPKN